MVNMRMKNPYGYISAYLSSVLPAFVEVLLFIAVFGLKKKPL